jgi:LPPG:FO 2-phospho-L-lactate transferase
MVTFLSGGTGTPKLFDGIRLLEDFSASDITVIANVGDDILLSGNLVCPDVDSVLYALSGHLDRSTWYGIEEDTYQTHEFLLELDEGSEGLIEVPSDDRAGGLGRGRSFSGRGEFMKLGDRDRAVHIYRTALLEEGYTLTEAINRLAERLGTEASILPSTDDPVSSKIISDEGEEMHFQDYWVNRGGAVDIDSVRFEGAESASPTTEVQTALSDTVVIGPANPVTSIGPMLALESFRDALDDTFVLGIAPFVGATVFSGPAGDLLQAEGYEASTLGWFNYLNCLDAVILDREDPTELPVTVYRDNLEMSSERDRERLARRLFEDLEPDEVHSTQTVES